MKSYRTILFLTCILFFTACKKETNSASPEISFLDFTKKNNPNGADTEGTLRINFKDADGDIGLKNGDTTGVFHPDSSHYYNLWITYYEKQNGIFYPIDLPIQSSIRVPELEINGLAEGVIETTFFINNPFSTYDTIRYEVTLFDRALHKSNTITTPEIYIKK
jgi:hypothetical protein